MPTEVMVGFLDEHRGTYGIEPICAVVSIAPCTVVDRDFTASRANAQWLANLTCVVTWRRLVSVAFRIDAFSRRNVGWRASTWRRTEHHPPSIQVETHRNFRYDLFAIPSVDGTTCGPSGTSAHGKIVEMERTGEPDNQGRRGVM